jgi:hypothetical protein
MKPKLYIETSIVSYLNNAFTRSRIREVVESQGYRCPELCSPDELLGEKE